MPELPQKPNLRDYQRYVQSMESERGFAHQNIIEKCLLLGEEQGELFKAVRKAEAIAVDRTSDVHHVGDELADIFIYVCAIANRYDIDLETAFREKEKLNNTRKWQQ